MIKLAINNTGVLQGFYNHSNQIITAFPNEVVNVGIARSIPAGFEPIPNFIEYAKKKGATGFYFQRTFALGDTLMAVPVVRHCQKLGWDVRMKVSSDFIPILDRLGIQNEIVNYPPTGLGILMDWIVEQDIGDEYLGKMHRVAIYFEALGLPVPDLSDLDWSCDLDKFPVNPVEGNYVVFQGQGANKRKWLNGETIVKILKALNDGGIRVIYTGEPRDLKYEHPLTTLTVLKYKVSELFPIIAGAKCLITMDSGPLWIGHFTLTPTVAIMGPSHEKQRLAYHPLYPEGAVGIPTNEWIGCKSCAEAAKQCKGDMTCLKANPDRVAEEVLKCAKRFWEV